jgi:hypothetical protein
MQKHTSQSEDTGAEDGPRDWNNASASQGMPKMVSKHQTLEEARTGSPQDPSKRLSSPRTVGQ